MILVGCALELAQASTAGGATVVLSYGGTIKWAMPDAPVKVGERFSGLISFDPDRPDRIFHLPKADDRSFHVATNTRSELTYTDYQPISDPPGSTRPDSRMTLDVGGRPIFDVKDQLRTRIESGSDATTGSNGFTSVDFDTDDGNKLLPKTDGFAFFVRFSKDAEDPWKGFDRLAQDSILSEFPLATLYSGDYRSFFLNKYGPKFGRPEPDRSFQGNIDTFQVVSTPEPSSLALIGLGAASWLIRRRANRTRRAA